MDTLTSPKEITEILEDYSEQVARDFGIEPSRGKHTNRFTNLRNGYFLKVDARGGWKLIRLFGPPLIGDSEELLVFSVLSPSTGVESVASRLVRIGGKVELLHDGRVTTRDGRRNPFFKDKSETINIDGRMFFRIGPLAGATTFDRMIEYHESRLSVSKVWSAEEIAAGAYVGDPGVGGSGTRSAGVWEARHSLLWTQFVSWLGSVEPLLSPQCRPDHWFAIRGRRFLIEMKPDSGLQSITTAIGQLLVYDQVCGGENVRVLVSPPLSSSSVVGREVRSVLDDHNIIHIEAKYNGRKYAFSDPQGIFLSRNHQ